VSSVSARCTLKSAATLRAQTELLKAVTGVAAKKTSVSTIAQSDSGDVRMTTKRLLGSALDEEYLGVRRGL
jgi:hypothetical protein